MVIQELYLKHFGKFTETKVELPEGVAVFYGENEYGKSTMYAFIKAMLFGMERGRGKAAAKSEFSRYEPWENPNYYAGAMRFRCGERTFRLERQFDRYGKSVSLICEDDGEELSVEDGDLDMLLGGVSASSFQNVAAIGQLSARPGQELAAELKNFAANYYETGSGEVDFYKTIETLKLRKKEVGQQKKAVLQEQKQREDQIRQQGAYVRQELVRKQQEGEELQEQIRATLKNQSKAESQDDVQKSRSKKHVVMQIAGIVMFVCGILGLACAVVSNIMRTSVEFPLWSWWVFVVGTVIGLGLAIYGRVQKRADPLQSLQILKKQLERLQWSYERNQEEVQEKQIQLHNLQEQLEETKELPDQMKHLYRKEQALDLAIQRMHMAAEGMAAEFGTRLNEETSRIFEQITDGRYSKVRIEDNLEMSVISEGKKIMIERLSRGTIEQVYFSLRMAAINLLYEEDFPVIFDDAFVYYDEKRLKSTLKWLSEQPRQVIIFSCQEREMKMFRGRKS